MKIDQLTNFDFLVLCGGRGTRSENPHTAKILQRISDNETIIDLLFKNFGGFESISITFLVGNLKEVIKDYYNKNLRHSYPNLQVHFIEDSEKEIGTAAAVLNALKSSEAKYFGVIFGDTALSFDVHNIIDRWNIEEFDVALVAHPNSHPQDSDLFFIQSNGQISNYHFKGSGAHIFELPFLSTSGMVLFKRNVLEFSHSLENDIVKRLIELTPLEKITFINSSYYQKDSGTAARIAEIRRDFEVGAINRRGGTNRSAIFLDRDGTLIPDIEEGRTQIQDSEIEVEAARLISLANSMGIPIFLITNQPAVAKGYISIGDVLKVQSQIQAVLLQSMAFLDDFRFCPHHPQRGFDGEVIELKIDCNCRKPKIGMLEDIEAQHSISLQNSVLIGDSAVDQETAYNAKMKFISATSKTAKSLSLALQEAIDLIIDAD